MPGRVYSPDPCFPERERESQTSSAWKRDTLCAVTGRPSNSRSRKPHGGKKTSETKCHRHAANGPSATVLRGEMSYISSRPTHGCGVGLAYPWPQGPGHRMVGCILLACGQA